MPQTPKQACKTGVRCAIDFHHLTPRQGDWMNCLLAGVIAALPYFIEAFITCLGGGSGGTADDYRPGDRDRC